MTAITNFAADWLNEKALTLFQYHDHIVWIYMTVLIVLGLLYGLNDGEIINILCLNDSQE